MKTDAPTPESVPKKRRQLERAPDLWLAEWLTRPGLTPSERRRLEEEKGRRREGIPAVLVVLRPQEGITPEQKQALREHWSVQDTHYWTAGRDARGPEYGRERYQELIKQATIVVALPKEQNKPHQPPTGSVWEAIRYARHRGLPVHVVMPTGDPLHEED